MPTEKKWVVDEKGFHAVNVHTAEKSSSSSGNNDTGASSQTQDDTKEVRLIKGTWLPGDDGFVFNKKCKVQVKLEYLKETSRKKLQLQTFVEFEGEEEDLKQTVDAFANDKGVAEAEIMLYFGEKYAKALEENPGATCKYKFIAVHPKGTKELASELLEMPHIQKGTINILEVEDALFRHDSAVFLPDSNYRDESGTDQQENISGINVIKSLLNRAFKFKDQKIFIAGHTDKSGPDDYNFKLSKMRADSFLFLVLGSNSKEEWAAIANEKNVEKDIQHVLKWAAHYKSWNCDPGKVDGIIGQNTKAAIISFHYELNLSVDDSFNKASWEAIYDLYQEKLSETMKGSSEEEQALSNRKSLNWAHEPEAVGFGEMWPKTSKMKSQTDRRVEVLFFDENEWPGIDCTNGICKDEKCKIYLEEEFERNYIKIDGTASLNSTTLKFTVGAITPIAVITNKKYKLEVGNDIFEGVIPDTSLIEHTIENDLDKGRLYIKLDDSSDEWNYWDFEIKTIDPIDVLLGIKTRLTNLGFNVGKIDDEMNTLTANGVCCFQEYFNLKIDGNPGPVTQNKLKEVYGC